MLAGKIIRLLCCVLVLTLLCGCGRALQKGGGQTADPSAAAVPAHTNGPEQVSFAGMAEIPPDSEVQAALDSKDSRLIWQLDGSSRLDGSVSVWTCTPIDCFELWPELQEALFPGVEAVEETAPGSPASTIRLKADGVQLEVKLSRDLIQFHNVDPAQLREYMPKLAEFMERKTGMTMQEIAPEPLLPPDVEILAYGYFLDGVPVYARVCGSLPGCGLVAGNDRTVALCYPFAVGKKQETFALADRFSMDELKMTAELSAPVGAGSSCVSVMRHLSLAYYYDPTQQPGASGEENTFVVSPIWSLTGTLYDFENGESSAAEMVFDALSGSVKGVQ